jgi:hypothetical protein
LEDKEKRKSCQVGNGHRPEGMSPALVRAEGLEPTLPKELDPKSSASANSATAPWCVRSRDPLIPLIIDRSNLLRRVE